MIDWLADVSRNIRTEKIQSWQQSDYIVQTTIHITLTRIRRVDWYRCPSGHMTSIQRRLNVDATS